MSIHLSRDGSGWRRAKIWGCLNGWCTGQVLAMRRFMARALPVLVLGFLAAESAAQAESPITKAQATAFAQQVNLVASDIPGAEVGTPGPERTKPSKAAVRFARCAGAVDPSLLIAEIRSPPLGVGKGRNLIELQSGVEVLPTAALAKRNFDATRSARGRSCMRRLLGRANNIKPKHGRLVRVSVSFLPTLLAGGGKSFGARIAITLINGARRLTIYMDAFSILAGPAEVDLNVVGAFHPPSTVTERRLLSVLYSRALAHKL